MNSTDPNLAIAGFQDGEVSKGKKQLRSQRGEVNISPLLVHSTIAGTDGRYERNKQVGFPALKQQFLFFASEIKGVLDQLDKVNYRSIGYASAQLKNTPGAGGNDRISP